MLWLNLQDDVPIEVIHNSNQHNKHDNEQIVVLRKGQEGRNHDQQEECI